MLVTVITSPFETVIVAGSYDGLPGVAAPAGIDIAVAEAVDDAGGVDPPDEAPVVDDPVPSASEVAGGGGGGGADTGGGTLAVSCQ